jgi:hypothetical protein
MAHYELGNHSLGAPSSRPLRILAHEWPYLMMLLLALFGIAYTNIASRAMTNYWISLAPVFGAACVAARWRAIDGRQAHLKLIAFQAFHWAAVISAMYLVFTADVRHTMSEDATALMALTVLALGTFTAGIHILAWRLCLVGIVLGLGVPSIAWFEERTLLVFLLAFIAAAAVVTFFVIDRKLAAWTGKSKSAF